MWVEIIFKCGHSSERLPATEELLAGAGAVWVKRVVMFSSVQSWLSLWRGNIRYSDLSGAHSQSPLRQRRQLHTLGDSRYLKSRKLWRKKVRWLKWQSDLEPDDGLQRLWQPPVGCRPGETRVQVRWGHHIVSLAISLCCHLEVMQRKWDLGSRSALSGVKSGLNSNVGCGGALKLFPFQWRISFLYWRIETWSCTEKRQKFTVN